MQAFRPSHLSMTLCLAALGTLGLHQSSDWLSRNLMTGEEREILSHLSIVHLDDGQGGTTKTIRITGVNVQIVNGLGSTNGAANPLLTGGPETAVNGLGNLIVGYNELGHPLGDDRTGSHNLVVGALNSYSSFGGHVSGFRNGLGNGYTTISGGVNNRADGPWSTVAGGQDNAALGSRAVVGGGWRNVVSGSLAVVSGGTDNEASGDYAVVVGGDGNTAVGQAAAILGGENNLASGGRSVVAGGLANTASGSRSLVGGGRLNVASAGRSAVLAGTENLASGRHASVSGGASNTAVHESSTISGGCDNTTAGPCKHVP